jgi:hypothetical protein
MIGYELKIQSNADHGLLDGRIMAIGQLVPEHCLKRNLNCQ